MDAAYPDASFLLGLFVLLPLVLVFMTICIRKRPLPYRLSLAAILAYDLAAAVFLHAALWIIDFKSNWTLVELERVSFWALIGLVVLAVVVGLNNIWKADLAKFLP